MPHPDTVEAFISRVLQGAHAEAIEAYYTEQASMRENFGEARQGRALLVDNERRVLAQMRTVRTECVRPVLVDGDHVVTRWIFEFETLDGRRSRLEELAYQRWEGERIAESSSSTTPRSCRRPAPDSCPSPFAALAA